MGESVRERDVFDPIGWPQGGALALGVATAFSALYVPVLFGWLMWVTFYPGPFANTATAPPDVLISVPVMGAWTLLTALATLAWTILTAVNAKTSSAKVLWAFGVLVGGGIVQAVAYFIFVWNPRHESLPVAPAAAPRGV